jgi:hypothetical protein
VIEDGAMERKRSRQVPALLALDRRGTRPDTAPAMGRLLMSGCLGLLVLLVGFAQATAGPLQDLAGPRASRWGDSTEKVIRAEGRDAVGFVDAACLTFNSISFGERLYVLRYDCVERGRGLDPRYPWKHGNRIGAVSFSPMPFTDQGSPAEALAWWEAELSRKYGQPQQRLDAPPTRKSDEGPWPYACPKGRTNLAGWDAGDCPLPYWFTTYRRWTGPKTVIELFDSGVYMNQPEVVVVFTERTFFDAAEAAHSKALARLNAHLKTQAEARKAAPTF